jgi:hypothetical protein
MIQMKQRNVAAALVLLATVLGYATLTARLPATTLPDTPGPTFLPWINTALLGGLALLLLAQGLNSQGTVDKGEGAETDARSRRPVIFLLALIGYIAVLPTIGFVVASIVFFAVAMILFGERRPLRLFLGSVGVPVLLFAIFRHGFNIVLPRGIMPVFFG